jgi:hypothetical protein
MMLDRRLQLFDVLGSTFSECRLGLAVPLLSLLRRGIDLETIQHRSGAPPNLSLLAFGHLCASELGHFRGRSSAHPTRARYPRSSPPRTVPPWERPGRRRRWPWPPSRAWQGRCRRSPVQRQPARLGKAPGLPMCDGGSALNQCPNALSTRCTSPMK